MVPIKLSVKIILIFSVVMLIGLLLFSSFAARTTLEGANAFTESRFRNMATSIERELVREYRLMEMTLLELSDNSTFMAALNQIVRDDSDDLKMADAAEKIALQQLVESPLVDMYYRVSFFTKDGIFLTSSVSKDSLLTSRSEKMQSVIAGLSWLPAVDRSDSPVILPKMPDFFHPSAHDEVYGLCCRVEYHGTTIGYLSVVNRYDSLKRITGYVDEPDISVEAVFDNGDLLFSSEPAVRTWPGELQRETLSSAQMEDGTFRTVWRSRIDSVGLNIYISQDSAVSESGKTYLRNQIIERALLIMIPAVLLIIVVSIGLTRSIEKLTKKVRQVNTASVFRLDDETAQALLTPVTRPFDRETHTLEMVFDRLMIRLRESTANELALREGTLQAQLNALQTQINPHFIYNTLNIISAKSMESGNYEIIEICDQFADMLRYSTDTRSRTATMADEIRNVRNYLMLAKARYEENLEYTIDVPENLETISVPKLMLQPLVENAMTHGFDGTNIVRKLSVTGKVKSGILLLEIRDNGNGFSNEMLESLRARIREIEEGKVSIEESGGHIGLINTCLRLHYYSHGKMRVTIRNDHGAVITLMIPFEKRSAENS